MEVSQSEQDARKATPVSDIPREKEIQVTDTSLIIYDAASAVITIPAQKKIYIYIQRMAMFTFVR